MPGLSLIGQISLDGVAFERGLNRLATSSIANFRNMVLGSFGIFTIQQAFKKTMDTADELVNTSRRLGVGVEQLQVLKQAAKDSTVELSAVAKAFEKINDAREEALSGSKEGQKLLHRFAQLGISKADLQSQTSGQLFLGPVSNAVKTRSSEDVAPILKDLLGKGFGELIPVLASDFAELEKKMKSIGAIMDTKTAVALDQLGDQLSLVSSVIIVQLGPAIIHLTFWILEAIAKIKGAFTFWDRLAAEVEKRTGEKPSKMEMVAAMTAVQMSSGTDSRDSVALNKDWADSIAAAADAGLKIEKLSLDQLEELKKKFDEMAKKLDNPTPSKNTKDDRAPDETKKKNKLDSGDALIRVGNFLGTSQQTLANIGEQQVRLLQAIANNTKPKRSTFMGDANGGFLPYA
jgi:hypothetical protein